MLRSIILVFLLGMGLNAPSPAFAQQAARADDDGSSEQVEESDEAFRRRMELEDARRRDPAYTPPAGATHPPDEKIDGLPAASRENIRDQMLDVIMENGEWEPKDALEEYPYDPTAAARADPELLKQEQAAWDEQIEKYHQREAEAFGAHRGAAPGPNDPKNGNAMAGEGDGGGEGESGQAGAGGGSEGQAGSAGSYGPYTSSQGESSEEASTAGAQQSALEFLRRQQGAAGSSAPPSATAAETASASAAEAAAEATSVAEESASDDATETTDLRGLIAIEDLDKLEGTGGAVIVVPPPEESEDEDPR